MLMRGFLGWIADLPAMRAADRYTYPARPGHPSGVAKAKRAARKRRQQRRTWARGGAR